MANFPTSLDSFTTKVDNVDAVVAAHINDLQSIATALEAKLGIDSSGVTTSVDYLLRHLPTQAGNFDIGSFELRGQTLNADVTTGTAPLTITSTTKVANLNVDKLDDLEAADFVRLSGTVGETITGAKAFSGKPTFNANIDMNQTEILNAVIEKRTSDPSSPVTGQIWFRTDV